MTFDPPPPAAESPLSLSFHHLALPCRDLFVMERFYTEALGFKRHYRHHSLSHPGTRLVFLQGFGFELELISSPGPAEAIDGPRHFALTDERIEGIYHRLAQCHVHGLSDIRMSADGYLEFSFADPEGNRIEICRRVHPFQARRPLGVIFDLDGTLIDSEENYYEADRRMLERHGITMTREMKREYVGIGNLQMMRLLRERYTLPDSDEALLEEKNRLYTELARAHTLPFSVMRALIKRLFDEGLSLSVASGTSRPLIDELLAATGYDPYLPIRVSSEEVDRPKPAPDVFLKAAELMGIHPSQLVVIEDAVPGIEAAIRAGMRVIAIPTFPEAELSPVYHMADLLVPGGMIEMDPAAVATWILEPDHLYSPPFRTSVP